MIKEPRTSVLNTKRVWGNEIKRKFMDKPLGNHV